MKFKHISIEDREKIQVMLWEKRSVRYIARTLGRSHSSIVRELKRNKTPIQRKYTPRQAHIRALEKRRCRGRKDRLKTKEIREYVVKHLKLRWSPEQISGRMKKDGVGTMSHEAIYQYIYSEIHRDGWGLLRPGSKDLRIYLRRRRKRRMKKGLRKVRVFKLKGRSIDDRPDIVGKRTRIGDWESDSVESKNHKPGVNTLLERKTGLYLITKLKDKASLATTLAISNRLRYLPKHTVTFDNGPENSEWKILEERITVDCFFAHPYSSFERGSNENANGLLREYFPKGTDFTKISDEDISKVEYDLNTRPRKRLGYLTPLEAMSGAIEG